MGPSPAPPPLEPLVRHAERLGALLLAYELTPPAHDAPGQRWLLGRAAEVERYVESVVDDVARGVLDEAGAVAALGSYLDGLHAGLAVHLGMAGPPPCCRPRTGRRRWRLR